MKENGVTQSRAKPVGMVLIIVYTGISALLSVLGGAGLMLAGAIQQWAPLLGFALLALGVLSAAAVYGLWIMVPWGYSITRIIYIVSIPLGLVALLADRTPGNMIMQLVGIGLAIVVLSYLAKPGVKDLFKKRGQSGILGIDRANGSLSLVVPPVGPLEGQPVSCSILDKMMTGVPCQIDSFSKTSESIGPDDRRGQLWAGNMGCTTTIGRTGTGGYSASTALG